MAATARSRPTLPSTRPWTPALPVWKWPGIPAAVRARALEYFEERAAIIEYDGGQSIGPAELRAYCLLIETMHDKGAFTSEHMQKCDVVRQLNRLDNFRRSDGWGRLIAAGKHGKKNGRGGSPERTTASR